MSLRKTDEDLRQYSKHLCYEVKMMQKCLDLLEKQEKHGTLWNALIESFLIHVRVIWDFLYHSREINSHNVHKDDIVARDFFDEPHLWQQDDSQLLKDTCAGINKALAHLTQARLSERPWDCNRIHDELVSYLRKFIHRVPTTRLDSEMRHLALFTSLERGLFNGGAISTSPDFKVTIDESDGEHRN